MSRHSLVLTLWAALTVAACAIEGPVDVDAVQSAAKLECGDGVCRGNETATSCPEDCGSCAATCGDGAVECGEQCDDGNTAAATASCAAAKSATTATTSTATAAAPRAKSS